MRGKRAIKNWSAAQSVMSLFPSEAEYYGMVEGGSVGLGLKALLNDVWVEVGLHIKRDASAAIAVASRRGRGNVRHIEVRQLWLRHKVRKGEINAVKKYRRERI